MYEEEVTIPLVFWSEDGRLGHHVLPYSRQIDIAPTIADLMGVMQANVPVQGVSLLRQGSRPAFMATFFDDLGAALVEPPFKYIYEQSTGRLLAFDDSRDPLEQSPLNLPSDKQQAVIRRIRSFMAYQKQNFRGD
jgi:arylsulfatase A-like enzyme